MTYYDKKECYEDVYLSLALGVLGKEDVEQLIQYYKELEHYECCAGIVQAHEDYKRNKQQQYED
jgi:hypothetical protein